MQGRSPQGHLSWLVVVGQKMTKLDQVLPFPKPFFTETSSKFKNLGVYTFFFLIKILVTVLN